ncbi:MAG: ribonuclease D [Alphaproteobacteria bacterium]
MTIHLHHNDLPEHLEFGPILAIDTEAMGLKDGRDRLCVVQLSDGNGEAHLVRFSPGHYAAPHLSRLLSDPQKLKLLHYARFDMAIIKRYLNIMLQPVYCTKIASKIARTYTGRHGLKELAREIGGVEISKQQQSSDWGAEELTEAQCQYAANDVLHLHAIHAGLEAMLKREGRQHLLDPCLSFLPHRVELDLAGWNDHDIFSH